MRPIVFVALVFISLQTLQAAIVVTSNERIAGTIVAKTKSSVTLRMEDGNERTIERDRIVQIFDDNGDLVYASPALVSTPVNTPTADSAKEPGYHTHDGFYLRLLLGLGSLAFSESPIYSNGTGTLKATGPAGFFSLHLGGAPAENFIIYASMNGYAASDPQYEVNGATQTTTTGSTLGISSYGVGLTFYFDAINAYLSADAGIAIARISTGSITGTSESGFGLNLQIGKEWWASRDWGIGVALFYHYSSMKDQAFGNVVPQITNSVIGLALSATYN